MLLSEIIAQPNPVGNRVDLEWKVSHDAVHLGVRVVCREGCYPEYPDDGRVVAEGIGLQRAADTGLMSEKNYYYSLFLYEGEPRVYHDYDRLYRAESIATGDYGLADLIYNLLPPIYHRYDDQLPDSGSVAAEDLEKGLLRRLMDIPAGELNLLYSSVRHMLKTRDVNQASGGKILPLLAQWIGWNQDTQISFDRQRNEIRQAPSIYQRISIVPTAEATVKRISGWESRSKEFVYNVAASNRPERLNLWMLHGGASGPWQAAGEMISLDHAFDGRPALVLHGGKLWLFYHTPRLNQWDIWYKTYDLLSATWSPSRRFTNRPVVDKYPVAVSFADHLYLFWSGFDEESLSWGIHASRYDGMEWSELELPSSASVERKQPMAVVANDRLYLFWKEKGSQRWQLKYSSRTASGPWSSPELFPDSAGAEADIHAVYLPDTTHPHLLLFWARKGDGPEPGQQRWEIAYRIKKNMNPASNVWSNVRVITKSPHNADWHDKEPFAAVNDDGDLELFWSSNREDQGWSVWSSRLTGFDVDPSAVTDNWSAHHRVTGGVYTQNNPALVYADSRRWLIYRSNEHLLQKSEEYQATTIVDERYNGSITVDTRHAAKHRLRGGYDDFQTYSYDAGQSDDDWYARDALGIYLDNDTLDETTIERGIERLKPVIKEFVPINDRAIFFPRRELHKDRVYNYVQPLAADAYTIGETYSDEFNGSLLESIFPPGEGFGDGLE